MAIIISDDLIIKVVVNSVETKTIDNHYDVGAPNTYLPGKDFSAVDNVSAGVVTSYQLGISLSSKSNQSYPIDKLFLQSATDPKTDGTGSIPFYLINSNPNPEDIIDDNLYTVLPGYSANMTSVVLGPSAGVTSTSTVNLTLNVNYPEGVYWKTKIAPKIYAVAVKDNIEQKSDLLLPMEVRMSSTALIENDFYRLATEWSGIRLTTQSGQKGFDVPFYFKTSEKKPDNLALLLDSPNPDTITYEADLAFTIDGTNIPILLPQITASLQNGMPGVSIQDVSMTGSKLSIQLKRNGNMNLPVIVRVVAFLPYDPGSKTSVTMNMTGSWGTPTGVIFNNWVNKYIFSESTIGGISASQVIPLVFVNPPTLTNSVSSLVQAPNTGINSNLSFSNINFISTAGSKMMIMLDSVVGSISDALPLLQLSYTPLGQIPSVTIDLPTSDFLQQYAYVDLPTGYDPNTISKNVFNGSVTLGTYAQILASGHKPNILLTTILTDILTGLPINYENAVSISYQNADIVLITNEQFAAIYQSNPVGNYTSYLYTAMQVGTNYATVAAANAQYGALLGTGDQFIDVSNKVYLYLATKAIGTSGIINRFNRVSTVRSDIPVPVYRSYFKTQISENGKDTISSIFDYTQTYPLRFAITYPSENPSVDGKMLAGTLLSFTVPLEVRPYLYLVSDPQIYEYNYETKTSTLIATVSSYALLPGVIQIVLPQDISFHSDYQNQIALVVPVGFITPSTNLTFSHESTTYDPSRLLLDYPNQIVTGFSSATPYYLVTQKYASSILQGAGVDFSGLTVNKNFYPNDTSVSFIATVKNQSSVADDFYMALTVPTNKYNPLETSNNTQLAFINQVVGFTSNTVIYFQTASKATAQDIQMMKILNVPGTSLKDYYNTTIVNTWTRFNIGDILPNDVVMMVAYTPSVPVGTIVRVDYKVKVVMDPNTTETYINDGAFNYYSNASNLETQSNKVTIQNYNPLSPISIVKNPLTQNIIAKNGQTGQFTIEFNVPLAGLSYSQLTFKDQLPKALTLLPTSTMQIDEETPQLLNATITTDKLVVKNFTNPSTLAGKKVTIVLNVAVDDISKIPDDKQDTNQSQLVVNGDIAQTFNSNIVDVVYQFENPFQIKKSPLTQQLPKVLNTLVMFTITFDIPKDISLLTALVFKDSLDPSLSFDPTNSFLQIGATPLGLLPATVINNLITSDLTAYLAQAAGKTIQITIGAILTHPELLPNNNTIDNKATITFNNIPAYSFDSNIVTVTFGSKPVALPITKSPLVQTSDIVQDKQIIFIMNFTLPQNMSEYLTITFSDELASCLAYDNTNSTVQFGSTTLPLNATLTGNTVTRVFTDLSAYAGDIVTIKLYTTLAHLDLIPTNNRITNIGTLIVNDDITLKSTSNEVIVIFKKVNPHQPAINDVIESVALQQTALSHIINAEGEKIQKAMEIPDITSKQLLAINDSVTSTINSITQLETLLVQKIQIVDCGCE
ncbi:MAG: isopeptide-forming domain-containing fimbrial protein [Coprobacillus sp.]